MLKKIHKIGLLLMASLIMGSFLGSSLSFAKEMPKPGTTIDKSNYKQYAHLFPEAWAQAFENGFDGLWPSLKIVVAETKHYPMSKMFLDYSAKNRGRYAIDESGQITPFFNREGLPFPDLQPTDQDFTIKLMWNYDCRYQCDSSFNTTPVFEKRRGEPLRQSISQNYFAFFKSRMQEAPKPDLSNPIDLYKSLVLHWTAPSIMKNTIMLSYRYVDTRKSDDSYMYLPSLRRVLRAEANARSAPVFGSVGAPDDFSCFDGRIPEFTYTWVKEQQVLAIPDSNLTIHTMGQVKDELPLQSEGYEIREVYVIDIVAKDPKYPQSKKRIYIDKETLWPYYCLAWDRAGKLWKVFLQAHKSYPLGGGQQFVFTHNYVGADIQFGMSTAMMSTGVELNNQNFTYDNFTPVSLLKLGR